MQDVAYCSLYPDPGAALQYFNSVTLTGLSVRPQDAPVAGPSPALSFHFPLSTLISAFSTFHFPQNAGYMYLQVICRLFAGYSQLVIRRLFPPKETTNEIMRYSLELVLISLLHARCRHFSQRKKWSLLSRLQRGPGSLHHGEPHGGYSREIRSARDRSGRLGTARDGSGPLGTARDRSGCSA